MLHLKVKNNRQ